MLVLPAGVSGNVAGNAAQAPRATWRRALALRGP